MALEPWLIAQRLGPGAGPDTLGFRELFVRAHELSDVHTPLPPASAVLWRVLALLTARITGLDRVEPGSSQERTWLRHRRRVLDDGRFSPESVDRYFTEHADRFDLFHPERPWCQDPRLRGECPKTSGVNKLAWGRPAGQNQVWLGGHHHDSDQHPLEPGEAAWHLLATLGYGPSGMCSARVVRGRSERNVTAGPLRGSVSYHPLGRTLFESLILNIPYPGGGIPDPAPWERDRLNDPLAVPEEPTGLAGTLVNQSRHAVLLGPSPDGSHVVDAWVTWAWRERGAEPPLDPYLIHQTSKEGRVYPRPASAERAVWRDLDALLDEGAEGRYRPTLLDRCTARSGVPGDLRDALRLRAFGFDQDGQTRDKQWFTATTPAVLRWLQERDEDATDSARTVRRIGLSRKAAEAVGHRLGTVLKDAWKASNSPPGGSPTESGSGPWLHRGTSRYWSSAEPVFWDIAHDRDTTGYTKGAAGPGNAFTLLALAAYDEVTGPYCDRPRVAAAVEQHRGALFSRWTPTTKKQEGPA